MAVEGGSSDESSRLSNSSREDGRLDRRDYLRPERAAALGLACMLASHGWPLRIPTASMTPREIWESSDEALVRMLGVGHAAACGLLTFRKEFRPVAAYKELKEKDIELVALGDAAYPSRLARIHDPPPALFVRGSITKLEGFMKRPRVAIVGARDASRYGLDAARVIAGDLSMAGVCVISGMARGIDAAAHEGAVRAGNGGTVAVLGGGADVIYPRSNTALYRQIVEYGAIVTEYPPGEEPRSWRFPARNRIISGLADGVVVVEARERSGALITAEFSLEQGREVWAVPGSIFSDLSRGPHRLMRVGAPAIAGADDVLEDLGLDTACGRPPSGHENGSSAASHDLGPDERLILEALDVRPVHQDALSRKTGLSGARSGAALVTLELMGLARRDPAGGYTR
ncbi:MAG: DNA-protecting protein DprA [Thermoleophilia bacterium]|nr:DNA-protecting protein DprA [Thermoleophilia bacterium]